jgi:3-hydroxyacyl-CoA dehydrogenase
MGGGIAMACANAGVAVVLTDSGDKALDAGIATIRKNYDVSVSRGRLTADDVGQRMARILPVSTFEFPSRAGNADLIVEAVFEDLALKQQVFRELDRIGSQDASSRRTRPRSTSMPLPRRPRARPPSSASISSARPP